MCRCFFSDCPGVKVPEHAPFRCRDNVYVFIKELCEDQASGDCIQTWRPDPRGNHDQCSNCTRTQRYIFPEGVSISPGERKVHTPRRAAPNYAPPPYVRPPRYEDLELRVAPNSTAAAGPELPLTLSRFNLTVVPSMPTRRPPPSGTLGQPLRTSTAIAATRLAEPRLPTANFPTPAPANKWNLTGLRPSTTNTATRATGTLFNAVGYPIRGPETDSRRTGLRVPMAITATQPAMPGRSQITNLRRTGLRTPTPTLSPFRDLNSTATRLQPPAANFFSRPPTRRLFARPGSTDRLVPTVATRAGEAPTGQQGCSTSPPPPRVLPIVYPRGIDTHSHSSTVSPQIGIKNSPSSLPRTDAPRTAGVFLAPPPRHETRSPPIGVNLSEWDFEETAPQTNSCSDRGVLHEPTHVAHFSRGDYVIAARGGLGNSTFVHQSCIAQASQGSVNDVGSPIENHRSSRWGSVRERARRTGERTVTSNKGGSSRSGGQANQRNTTQWRQSLAESLQALRRRPFTWRRQINQSESASHQAQAEFESSPDPVHITVALNDQPTAVVAGDQSTNHELVTAASGGHQSTQLSNCTVSEVLRRTRDHVPDSSDQRSHASSESDSITTFSALNTRSECSQDRGYDSGNHPPQSSESNRSSSSGHTSIQGQRGGEEMVEKMRL